MASRRNPHDIASAALAMCEAPVVAGSGAAPVRAQSPSAQVALLVGGAIGGGTLSIGGETHDVSIGRLGIGGIGASRLEASDEIFNLRRLEDFEGPYAQAGPVQWPATSSLMAGCG